MRHSSAHVWSYSTNDDSRHTYYCYCPLVVLRESHNMLLPRCCYCDSIMLLPCYVLLLQSVRRRRLLSWCVLHTSGSLYSGEAGHTTKEHGNKIAHTTKKTRSRVTQKCSVATTAVASTAVVSAPTTRTAACCESMCITHAALCSKKSRCFVLEARHIDAATSHRAAAAVLELKYICRCEL